MKRTESIIRWIASGILSILVLLGGFDAASFAFLLAMIPILPIAPLQKFLREKMKIKKWLAIVIAIVMFVAGISLLGETEPSDTSGNPSISTQQSIQSEESSASLPSENESHSSSAQQSSSSSHQSQQAIQSPSHAGKVDGIPAYNGQPYVALNGNVPVFSQNELTNQGYESYQALDSLGRTQRVIASLGKETMPKEGEKRGDISKIYPSGWIQAKYENVSGGWLYNRCHLIGWQLSAENANSRNLITGTKYFNIEGMLPFENMVADYIKETGNHVAYRVTPYYVGNNLLASGVQIEAFSVEDNGEGICFNIYCYNVQPGISIDYATGASAGKSSGASSVPSSSSTSQVEPTGTTVYLPTSGKKYHRKATCGAMKNGTPISLEQAKQQGYTPCGNCYK